jgi:hypothetical protein
VFVGSLARYKTGCSVCYLDTIIPASERDLDAPATLTSIPSSTQLSNPTTRFDWMRSSSDLEKYDR